MDLFGLRKNLNDLQQDELLKLVLKTRASRRTSKKLGSAPKKRAAKPETLDMTSIMGLGADDLERLIKQLEGSNESGGSEN